MGGRAGDFLYDFTDLITVEDTDGAAIFNEGEPTRRVTRKHADFNRNLLLPGGVTFWIGMSGTNIELGQLS
jgi:hypothetical protein